VRVRTGPLPVSVIIIGPRGNRFPIIRPREVVRGARRQRKENPRQKLALSALAVRKICEKQKGAGTAEAARARLILTLGVATGLRPSN